MIKQSAIIPGDLEEAEIKELYHKMIDRLPKEFLEKHLEEFWNNSLEITPGGEVEKETIKPQKKGEKTMTIKEAMEQLINELDEEKVAYLYYFAINRFAKDEVAEEK